MLQALTTVSLREIYCRSCHLATRSDLARCLHCNKVLAEPAVARKPAIRKLKARRHAR